MADQKKTVDFNEANLGQLPNNKPVVYKILNNQGDNIYTGIAKRGRVQDRLGEHLKGRSDFIPGAKKVQVQQKASIAEAEKTEKNIISRSKPKLNKKGK